MTPGEYRLRIAYAKVGRLRWLSHLEIVHSLERMIRRAELPYAITQGFSPHMKCAFGPALPVGTAGENEYLDVWLTRYTEPGAILRMLTAVAPDDLAPHSARFVSDKVPALTAALTIAIYRVEIVGREIGAEKVHAALTELVSAGEFAVEHKGKQKVFDLARSLPKEACVSEGDDSVNVELFVRMGPQGSLRPELLIRAALASAGIEVSAVRTTRQDLFIEDDEGVWSRPV